MGQRSSSLVGCTHTQQTKRGWIQRIQEVPGRGTGSEPYSGRGIGLLRLLSQEGQHLLHLQLLFLADVVTVCGGGAGEVSKGSRGERQVSQSRGKRRSKQKEDLGGAEEENEESAGGA